MKAPPTPRIGLEQWRALICAGRADVEMAVILGAYRIF